MSQWVASTGEDEVGTRTYGEKDDGVWRAAAAIAGPCGGFILSALI